LSIANCRFELKQSEIGNHQSEMRYGS